MKLKKTLLLVVSLVLVLSLAPIAQAQTSFRDVPPSHTFYEEIQFLVELGIISGFEDGTFRPGQAVTRAQAAIMIGRTFDLNGEQRKTIFRDVSKSSVASGYIQEAADYGIIQGYPDGTFRPNEPVSRGQMAILIARAFGLTESAEVSFPDVSPNSAAYPYIGLIYYAGITEGYPDGTYKPNQSVKRGEFAAFITRAIFFIISEYYDEENLTNEEYKEYFSEGLDLEELNQ
ncbi:S-layer homology domain-containing protein [Bacillus sp. AGMB 02131]|uniref:S-layer homology domain-containing protein n=1 Tax=Peribacillus faecalis TaxID=2772559 RepID=A0A927HBD5_9BACI|nr:S-layer homology domain-containing protein [Peribacillus faecalis]MBD3109625.1 S-layer homology domain-containing protein [Peribacillus faecalis]